MSQSRVTLILAFILISTFSWAGPITYGAEFEFFHPKLTWDDKGTHGESAIQAKKEFMHQVRERCAAASGCRIETISGKFTPDFKVTLANGWWFIVSHDPAVIEIATKPSTLKELRDNRDFINHFIFGSARAAKFYVNHRDNAHFNFGALSAFDNQPRELMKFFLDYHNNIHLGLGTLGQDLNNAPPLSYLKAEQREALTRIMQKVESNQFKTIPQLTEAIMKEVYTETYNKEFGRPVHFQALGLKYLTEYNMKRPFANSIELQALLSLIPFADFSTVRDQPMEMRAVWSQTSAEHFIKVAELIEARVDFLKKQSGPLVYLNSKRKEINSWQEAKTRFYIYVTETGLDFDKYKNLLPKEARQVEMSEFLNEALPIRERAKALRYYTDLIGTSQWFRDYAMTLILEGHLEEQAHFKEILNRIIKVEFNIQRTGEKNPIRDCRKILSP